MGEDGVEESDLLVHDEANPMLAQLLAAMEPPDLPVALGVIYCDPAPSYERQVAAQRARRPAPGSPDHGGLAGIDALLRQAHTWRVEG